MENNSSSLQPELRWANFSSANDVGSLNLFRGNMRSIIFSSLRGQLKMKMQEKGQEDWILIGYMDVCVCMCTNVPYTQILINRCPNPNVNGRITLIT